MEKVAFDVKAPVSLKRGKIGPRLLLWTNRKSHTFFRSVPKSTTLDDLKGSLCTLFQSTYALVLSVTVFIFSFSFSVLLGNKTPC